MLLGDRDRTLPLQAHLEFASPLNPEFVNPGHLPLALKCGCISAALSATL
jgi:hypothetical protein